MKALSDFFPRMLPFLPGCSEPLAAQMLVQSAIRFCETSLALRQNLDAFRTVAGVPLYDLDPPSAQHAVARVLGVALDGVELAAGVAGILPTLFPPQTGKPGLFYTDRTDSELTLGLTMVPDGVYTVVANVALRPARTATQLDDDLFDMWSSPVIDGAIAAAMQVPDQTFTNTSQAAYLVGCAAQGAVAARIEGSYGRIRGSMTVRPRPFA